MQIKSFYKYINISILFLFSAVYQNTCAKSLFDTHRREHDNSAWRDSDITHSGFIAHIHRFLNYYIIAVKHNGTFAV